MKLILMGFLFFATGCATRYLLPGNRFLTPETQGGAFRGQIEIQKTNANELSIDTTQNTVDRGVLYSTISRTGFLYSNSFFEQFDLYWSHVASANSMLGGKFQFLGGSRTSNALGHKMALAAAIGSNEHETDDGVVDFKLGGQEFLLLYGYRFLESVMLYSSLAQSSYNFSGKIHSSNTALNNQRPNIDSRIISASAGLEVGVNPVFVKLECTYQSINTQKTNSYTNLITGLSLGLSW